MSRVRSKILLAQQKDREIIEEDEVVYYENEKKEKFFKEMVKWKVKELITNNNYDEKIKQNIEYGKENTRIILNNINN